MHRRLATVIAAEELDRFHTPNHAMQSPGGLRGSAKQQSTLIEGLTGDANEGEESLLVPLRLLID